MNDFLSASLLVLVLILVLGMPLVLAFPMLRSRLSGPVLFALLPAIVLVIVLTPILMSAPMDFSVRLLSIGVALIGALL